MSKERYKPEQIVTLLRQIEVAVANGKSTLNLMTDKVFLRPPRGEGGEPIEVEATPEILTPLMIKGWTQYFPPDNNESESQPIRERETEVDDDAS